jgi:hypothetical protein
MTFKSTKTPTGNSGLAKVAVLCSTDTFVVNQSLVLRIIICDENSHLRQAAKTLPASLTDSTSKPTGF